MTLNPANSHGSLSTVDKWLEYAGSNVSIADGAFDFLTWDTYGDGDATIMSFTNPAAPTVTATGIYAVCAIVTGTTMTAGGYFELVVHMDVNDKDGIAQTQSRPAGATAGTTTPVACATAVFRVPAAGIIKLEVTNKDGASARNFHLVEAVVQRLQ